MVAEPMTQIEELKFLTAARPDGPVFGIIADSGHSSHVVTPTFVRGRDDGWFFANCYRCGRGERFHMHGQTYFDPFSGRIFGRSFSEAVLAGGSVRAEWMRRRKSLLRRLKDPSRQTVTNCT